MGSILAQARAASTLAPWFLTAALSVAPALALGEDAPNALVAPAERPLVPAFDALEGLGGSGEFTREDLLGTVTVINLWYEW